MVTLGRSDAMLACEAIKIVLGKLKEPEEVEDLENLLRFIEVQLNSIAEEEASPDLP
jgi:hypothetical protein